MKKNYPLVAEGKNSDRLLEATKHDIRKYVKRCRRARLPEGVDYWDFDCAIGADKDSATAAHLSELIGLVDAAAKEGRAAIFVEVNPKNGHRVHDGRAPVAQPELEAE